MPERSYTVNFLNMLICGAVFLMTRLTMLLTCFLIGLRLLESDCLYSLDVLKDIVRNCDYRRAYRDDVLVVQGDKGDW